MLKERRIEAGFDTAEADVRGQIDSGGDFVDRHLPRLVVRAGKLLVHPHGKARQIIEEERIEVIGIEHHDDVRADGGELLLLRREQLCGFTLRAVALDEKRKYRRVRHPEPGKYIRHLTTPCRPFTSKRLLCDISPGAVKLPEYRGENRAAQASDEETPCDTACRRRRDTDRARPL